MLCKKPALLFSTSSTLQSLTCPSYTRYDQPQRKKRATQRQPAYLRTLATTHDAQDAQESDLTWPETPASQGLPTPYQIFNQKYGEPYSKRRFYELVKLYHPDRNAHIYDSTNIPNQSKKITVERYHLIIAANEILSDPRRRHAYDKFGYGWSQNAEPGAAYKKYDTHRRDADGTSWYRWPIDQNPMYCATWEDWERWYEQTGQLRYSTRYRQRQRTHMNNGIFISLVAVVAIMSGIGQATHANQLSAMQHDRIQFVNDESNRILREARGGAKESIGVGESRRERAKRFLQERDGYVEGEIDGRSLSKDDPNVCVSDTTKDRDEEPFWKRPPENR